MADQVEQMGLTLETNQKKIEELQDKYENQVIQSSELSSELDATRKTLEKTITLLARTEEELKKSQYALKEKDFVISQQRNAEKALTHQACVLRSDLEKSLQDNASLFSKIAREDKLNSENRSVVDNFQAELAEKISALCGTVSTSMSRQNEHLQCVENLCKNFFNLHEQSVSELKKKLSVSKALYISHMEGLQNVVRLHKASSNAGLDEISSLVSANACSVEKFLAAEAEEANSIFGDLEGSVLTHQGEMAHFAKELRERFHVSIAHMKEMSDCIIGHLDKIGEETHRLESHNCQVHEIQEKSIAEFQKAYEEQSKSEAEKLLADVTNLVSNHIRRQKELVDERLVSFRETTVENKAFLDKHTSSIEGITTDAKRKWQAFSMQAENDAKDSADFSAAKHCRMELLVKQCISTVSTASMHWKKAHDSVNKMGSEHVSSMEFLVRNSCEGNEQHDVDICSARAAAEQDVLRNNEDILQHVESISVSEQESISGIMNAAEAHGDTVQKFREDHSCQAAEIEQKSETIFQSRYMDYEPSGATPERRETEIPSKVTIESLRAMPMDTLLEEFRETHPYERTASKEPKPSLIPRSPLIQLN
ncbi:hypothetical protein GIB67_013755 [Kingdonia uniflora]|uniref:Uncharacterized protein n=1 Tax=Kingdonia uniflora TaxID=39325 RepID=A0A7J7MN58_9MAGN|nr:hypothetical protein GIB67_013755 [Kingdonia uniflora]